MSIWALADLHLSISNPDKDMAIFGPVWKDYMTRIATNWKERVQPHDLVLIPGDTSWASSLDDAMPDLLWLDKLPGQKLLIRGNHDPWWASLTKMNRLLPPSLHALHNTAWLWHDVAIGGSRLWDSTEYTFQDYIIKKDNPKATKDLSAPYSTDDEKIFLRELDRLRMSLQNLAPHARVRIAMTHYPPIGPLLIPSKASQILEEFSVDICVFGHLHSIRPHSLAFGTLGTTTYKLVSADYVDFAPVLIL